MLSVYSRTYLPIFIETGSYLRDRTKYKLARKLMRHGVEGIYGMVLFAHIFYNQLTMVAKRIEFEALTLTDTSTVVISL